MAMAHFASSAEGAPVSAGPQERKIKAAMAFIRAELAAGPRSAGEMLAAGKAAGHAERTLQTAAKRLHIKPTRVYEGSRLKYWQWELPVIKQRKRAGVS